MRLHLVATIGEVQHLLLQPAHLHLRLAQASLQARIFRTRRGPVQALEMLHHPLPRLQGLEQNKTLVILLRMGMADRETVLSRGTLGLREQTTAVAVDRPKDIILTDGNNDA